MEDFGLKRIKRRHVIMIIMILVIVLLISIPVFLYFKISTESRLALREAKNVKLTFDMLDIEMYADNTCVFNPNKVNGLNDGVKEKVVETLEHDCKLSITSYSTRAHKVTGFVYSYGHYQVIYQYNEKTGDSWTVNYLFKILNYDGES